MEILEDRGIDERGGEDQRGCKHAADDTGWPLAVDSWPKNRRAVSANGQLRTANYFVEAVTTTISALSPTVVVPMTTFSFGRNDTGVSKPKF